VGTVPLRALCELGEVDLRGIQGYITYMETEEIKALVDLLQSFNPEKDFLDVFSSLSVPILSLTALIITTIISAKQWYLMKCEYRLKLYPERLDLYKKLIDLLDEFHQENAFIGDNHKKQIIKNENMIFLFGKDINAEYKKFIEWMNSVDMTKPDFDMSIYSVKFRTELSALIGKMKKYLLKKHIEIA
jgi:hypothetical protein